MWALGKGADGPSGRPGAGRRHNTRRPAEIRENLFVSFSTFFNEIFCVGQISGISPPAARALHAITALLIDCPSPRPHLHHLVRRDLAEPPPAELLVVPRAEHVRGPHEPNLWRRRDGGCGGPRPVFHAEQEHEAVVLEEVAQALVVEGEEGHARRRVHGDPAGEQAPGGSGEVRDGR